MVISPQYPHYLYRLAIGDGTEAEATEVVTAPAEWVFVGMCREETNGKGSQTTTTDGKALLFSSLIQLPTGTQRVDEGTEVMITEAALTDEELQSVEENLDTWRATGRLRIKGTSAKFDNGRLHCRLWV